MEHRWFAMSFCIFVLALASTARAQAEPGAPTSEDAAVSRRKEEARAHFEKGLLLFDEEAWDGALAEFVRSREIYPTRAATKNAAFCLRRLKRFDEALDLYEVLLEARNLPPTDRTFVEQAVSDLRARVGNIRVACSEPGATLVVDGRERGQTPNAPVRVTAGTHVVRIFKEGFEPFETRLEVAGGESESLDVRLSALARTGRLRVTEKDGKALTVVVDTVVVGQTPWEGRMAPGAHTVFLRGEGDIGTEPASAPVQANALTPLVLAAEALRAELRLEPLPRGAEIAIDGVHVGRGVWSGKLKAGLHRVEVAADGFRVLAREVTLADDDRKTETLILERDPTSPLWGETRGRFFVEASGAFALAPSLGGDQLRSCSAPCSRTLGVGGSAFGRGGYRFLSGFSIALEGGYLFLEQNTQHRAASALPVGLDANPGVADDHVQLTGAVVGASAAMQLGSTLPLTLRLGGGALFGRLRDHRTGTFSTTPREGVPASEYAVDLVDAASFVSIYAAPEARFAVRLAPRWDVGLGVRGTLLFTPSPPRWSATMLAATDGQASFDEALLENVALILSSDLTVKYEF